MPLNNTIQKNAQSLKEKGAPQEVIDNYIKLAQQEKTGIEKTADLGKEVIRGTTGFLAAPVAMLSEGIRGLTGTKQSGIEKKLTDFAFEGTKLGTRERGGVALERATDAASLIAAPMTKGLSFGKAALEVGKYGGKLGGAYGLANSLQQEEVSASKVFTDVILGTALGSSIGVGTFGVGRGLSAGYNGVKNTIKKVGNELSDYGTQFKEYSNQAKKFSEYVNNGKASERVINSVADLAMDINPHLSQQMRVNPQVREEIINQVSSGLTPNEYGMKIWKEMRDEVIKIDDDISAKFSQVQDELLSQVGKNKTDDLSEMFIKHLKENFDSGVSFSEGLNGEKIINFSPNSELSKADQRSISKLFSDEFSSRESTISSLVNVARIVDKGLPDEPSSVNLINFKKTLGGYLRDVSKQTINDPKWDSINSEYQATQDFLRQINPLIGSVKNYPNAVKLDEILTQLGRTFRVDKNARQNVIGKLEDKTGKKFIEALQAQEILKDFAKQKGIQGSQNLASAAFRLFDPAKISTFTSTVTGINPIKPLTSAVKNTTKSALGVISKSGDSLNSMINVFSYALQNEKTSKGVKLLYLMLLKELLFPTPTQQ